MKKYSSIKTVLLICLLAAAILSVPVWAAQEAPAGRGMGGMGMGGPGGGRGMFGDWDLKVQFAQGEMDAILSFSRGQDGELTGTWIGFMGVNSLQDIKFEDDKLSFVQVASFMGQESRSTFTGTITDGVLKGTMTSERGDSEVTGKPRPRVSRAAGVWDLKYKVGDMDIASQLIIKADAEGALSAEWKNEQMPMEVQISDVSYQRGTLTFKRKMNMGQQDMESTFEGTIDRQTGMLQGTMQSADRDPISVTGQRVGEAMIGTWNLDVTSEQGQSKQQLRVNPDLSGLYGTMAIKKIELKDGGVSFTATSEFGGNAFEMSFEGKLADDKLTGQLTTPMGNQEVKGTKAAAGFGGMRRGGAQ